MHLAARLHEELAQHDIPHWLEYGSLLGAARNGQLIPWDEDVDFGIRNEDRPRVVDVLRRAKWGHYDAKFDTVASVRINVSRSNLLHVDLFDFVQDGAELTSRWPVDVVWPGWIMPKSFPARFVDRLEPIMLEGHMFPAPQPVDEFLRDYRYGPAYLTPTRRAATWFGTDFESGARPEAVGALFEALGNAQRSLHTLRGRSGIREDSRRGRWGHAGRPVRPDRGRLRKALELVPPQHRTGVAHHLARALAIIEQEIEEQRNPSLVTSCKRMLRRCWHLATKLARRLEKARRRR
jgi:hypothetical protein